MKKYVDGVLFDTEDAQDWVLRTSRFTQSRRVMKQLTLYRPSDGVWISDDYSNSVHSMSRIRPQEAARLFTKYGVDIPSELVTDLEM